ncbi:MAG TPA: hypothetical protein VGN12_27930 [Pirellulales bacterium]|jgi:hypothetical protein
MSKNESTRPAFSAPLWAALRQGSKELAQALPAFPDSIRPIEEPGMMGNPTPQQVTEQSRNESDFQKLLDRYDSRSDGRDDRGQGMDR